MVSLAQADRDLHQIIDSFRPRDCGHDLIRIGGDRDGGYLVPDDLSGIRACLSPGVSTTADFEIALTRDWSIPCFLADRSVDGPPKGAEAFDFEPKFLGGTDDEAFSRLETWVQRKLGPDTSGDLLLQMDIEGAEYEVIFDTPASVWARFRVVVIEFHNLQSLFDPYGRVVIAAALRKLRQQFTVVHLHPNNNDGIYTAGGIAIPGVLEVTLLRNDRVKPARGALTFPHPLDRDNNQGRPGIALPRAWQ